MTFGDPLFSNDPAINERKNSASELLNRFVPRVGDTVFARSGVMVRMLDGFFKGFGRIGPGFFPIEFQIVPKLGQEGIGSLSIGRGDGENRKPVLGKGLGNLTWGGVNQGVLSDSSKVDYRAFYVP